MPLQSFVVRAGCYVAVLFSIVACAPSAYVLKEPTPSGMKFETTEPPPKTTLSLVDKRVGNERQFHSGRLSATLQVGEKPIEAPSFLARNLQAELVSRGVPIEVATGENDGPRINLHTFRVENWRATGFSPFVTFTFLSTEMETKAAKKRIGAFIKRGKVPVWSFDEVVEPTFNEPLSLAVKELAAKLAAYLYDYKASDKTTDELIAKINRSRGPESYLDVYALGFTNNPKAIDTMVRLTSDSDEYVRIAAISSLGTLGAKSQIGLLKSIYQNRDSLWQDRAMAIKSISDLDTDDSKTFLKDELKRWESATQDREAVWTAHVIRLYL